jgi:hypothetical protein
MSGRLLGRDEGGGARLRPIGEIRVARRTPVRNSMDAGARRGLAKGRIPGRAPGLAAPALALGSRLLRLGVGSSPPKIPLAPLKR